MVFKEKQRNKDQRKKEDVGAKLNALPATFKFAAETLKMMNERNGSIASIVVNKYKSYNYKHIFALAMNTAKNIKLIKKIIHEVKLAKKVPENDPFLLEILVGELLFGRGLKEIEQNSTASCILGHKEAILKQQKLLKATHSVDKEAISVKYLRVNLLKTTMEHVKSQLKIVGLEEVEYSKDKIKFKKFINKYKSLENNQYMLDFHFPDELIILKLEAANKIKKTDLLKKGKAMIQDKASFLAVEALDVKPTHKVIDACFAPGCKTSFIASRMKNKGKILAFDVDKKRYLSATHLMKIQGVTCAKPTLLDFSKVKLRRLAKVNNIDSFDSILIDPSCSGSGIHNRIDYKSTVNEAGRLKKLQAFQVSLLKHALKADISKTIVYCTCSTSTEENEQVIDMALNESGMKSLWDIVDVLPYWPHRGEANYEFGEKCLRSDENHLTNGFFIAKLERNQTAAPERNETEEQSEETHTKKKIKTTKLGSLPIPDCDESDGASIAEDIIEGSDDSEHSDPEQEDSASMYSSDDDDGEKETDSFESDD